MARVVRVSRVMLRVFFDAETLPPDEARRATLRSDVIAKLIGSKRVTEPDAESGDVAGLTDADFRHLALHGEYGRVLCIGVVVERDEEVVHRGVLGRDRATGMFHLDEARTLRSFWRLLTDFRTGRDLLIGHNIMEFDLPFLHKRSRINRVPVPVKLSFARYRSAPIYDTMREWHHWSRDPHISLAHLAEILRVGLAKTEDIDGSRIYDEFLAGNHELIARYCLRDVEVTRAVYYRMTDPDHPSEQDESQP